MIEFMAETSAEGVAVGTLISPDSSAEENDTLHIDGEVCGDDSADESELLNSPIVLRWQQLVQQATEILVKGILYAILHRR